MLDLGEIFATMQGTMLEGGYDTVEERDFFRWNNAEWERVSAATDMSEEEQHNRRAELAELKNFPNHTEIKMLFPLLGKATLRALRAAKTITPSARFIGIPPPLNKSCRRALPFLGFSFFLRAYSGACQGSGNACAKSFQDFSRRRHLPSLVSESFLCKV